MGEWISQFILLVLLRKKVCAFKARSTEGVLWMMGVTGSVSSILLWIPPPGSFYTLLMLTKWLWPTRLETRTKESSICASIRVRKTLMRNESEGSYWNYWGGNRGVDISLAHHRPVLISHLKDLSLSTSAGTRKRVNYACIGWSQRKLWWRVVAILTCKSFVKCVYRGERLIELSSSWFPPKFPSG
jgi:hypothetical protein